MGDVELVEAIRRGDPRAWADVYDRYGARLHAFCTRRLNEPHAAADAVQDTFVVAAARLDQLREPSKLRPWLYAIARNECTRQGRARGRLVPVEEPEVMSTSDVDDPANQAAAGEVAELLWAAAEGLDDHDKLLLELNVRHGLEGQELAEAAGIKPGQVSMATGRMRERIERSLGALLVARRGHADCAGLGVVLEGWDGTFTVLMRKRVARHIERCDLCDERRRTLVAPLGSLATLPFLPPPAELRDRVLRAVSSVTGTDGTTADPSDGPATDPARHEVWPGGFPPVLQPDRRRTRRATLAAVAAILLLVGAALVIAVGGGSDDGDTELVSGAGTTTTVVEPDDGTTSLPTTGSAPSPSAPTTTIAPVPGTTPIIGGPSTTTPVVVSPPSTIAPAPPVDGGPPAGQPGATPTVPSVVVLPDPTTPLAPTTTVPPAPNRPPTVGAPSAVAGMQASCNPANDTRPVTATVTDDRGVASAVLSWSGSAGAGSSVMTRSGTTWTGTLGPVPRAGFVTYQVVATDTDGATGTSTSRRAAADPCPG